MGRFFAKKRKNARVLNPRKTFKKPTIVENEEIEFPSDENDNLPANLNHTITSEQHQRKIKARKQLSDFFLQEKSTNKDSKDAVNEKLLASVMSTLRPSKLLLAGKISPKKRPSTKLTSCTSVNSLVLFSDSKSALFSTRNCNLIKFDLEANKPLKILRRRNCSFLKSEVLTMSYKSEHVLLGCRDGSILLINSNLILLKNFQHKHKAAVTGICFGHGEFFYSCSVDRTVKCWTLSSYLNTLYGHQQGVTDIDCFPSAEKVVTSGGVEGAVRVWKVMDDKQLVFSTAASLYIDCVAVVDDEHFVTGGTRNSLQMWRTGSGKPVFYVNSAHGEGDGVWVTTMAVGKNSDLFVSGGNDGSARFWRIAEDFSSFWMVACVDLGCGFVNGLMFTEDMGSVVCTVGREHRLGSWRRMKEADNVVCVVDL